MMDAGIVGVICLGATGAALFMYISPLRIALTMISTRSTGAGTPLPFALMALNAAVGTLYGIILREWVPLFASNIFGFTTSTFTLATFVRFASGPSQIQGKQLLMGLMGIVLALAAFLRDALIVGYRPVQVSAGVTVDTGTSLSTPMLISSLEETKHVENRVALLGNLVACVAVAMFAGPLANVSNVCRTGSTESLSLLMTSASFACASLWTIYGFIIGNLNIWGPNVCGMMLSFAQLSLFAYFGMPGVSHKVHQKHFPSAVELGKVSESKR